MELYIKYRLITDLKSEQAKWKKREYKLLF